MKKDQNPLRDPELRGMLQRGMETPRRNPAEPCPSPDLLDGYLSRKLSGGARKRVEDHMMLCPACMKALDALRRAGPMELKEDKSPRNWPLIEKEMDQRFYDRLPNKHAIPGKNGSTGRKKTLRVLLEEIKGKIPEIAFLPKRLTVAGALAIMAVACIYAFGYLSRDRYFQLARVEPELLPRMRAEAAESDFNKGLKLYGQAKYDEAIVHFASAVRTNPDQYGPRYYLGLSYLGEAESGLPGLPYKFRKSDVNRGIEALDKALVLGGDNVYYRADCHWYLGKAHLMIQEAEKARAHWVQMIELGQSDRERVDEAGKLLSKMR